jgi:hypothetical protein
MASQLRIQQYGEIHVLAAVSLLLLPDLLFIYNNLPLYIKAVSKDLKKFEKN